MLYPTNKRTNGTITLLLLHLLPSSQDAFIFPSICSSNRFASISSSFNKAPTTRTAPSSFSFSFPSKIQSTVTPRDETVASSSSSPDEINSFTSDDNSNTTNNNNENPSSRPFSKVLRLKDRMWVRETLEDLTAAEFAINFAPKIYNTSDNIEEKDKAAITNAVDFENLLLKLDKRLEDMCVRSTYGKSDDSCIVSYPLKEEAKSSKAFPEPDDECWLLLSNYGMGSVTYTDDQRSALVLRLLTSKQELVKAMGGTVPEPENGQSFYALSGGDDLDLIREKLQTPDIKEEDYITSSSSSSPSSSVSTAAASSSTTTSSGPYVYVRDDGTVDWDGALQDRAALKKFGTSVWARINGQDPEKIDESSIQDGHTADAHEVEENKVTVKIPETDAIREKKMKLDMLKDELKETEKKHTALLNSAVTAGSAVANVNLALLEPELRSMIRASDNELKKKKDEVSFETLIYELERIYTYLDGELGNTATKGNIPLQDRINVAEFGLLESQIGIMQSQIDSIGEIDSDVLAVVMDQTTDFKRRLGIDYYVTGFTYDPEGIKIWLNDFLLAKLKKALAFYGKGLQLLFNDIIFSSSLIGKALTGYTLKPREVTTLRRTFKDVINFIPFVIIWLIPLSPVGHALVFSAIQRFFPDFFPSSFTERRQNLLALYESTEFSEFTIEENWQQKIVRLLEATGYLIVDNAKKLGGQIISSTTQVSDGDNNNDANSSSSTKE